MYDLNMECGRVLGEYKTYDLVRPNIADPSFHGNPYLIPKQVVWQ